MSDSAARDELFRRMLSRRGLASASTDAIRRRARPATIPLSFAQERLWFLAKLEPESPFYVAPAVLTLRGHIHVTALQAAIDEIVRRHEILRTSFELYEGSPYQIVAASLSLTIPIVDLRHLPYEAARRTARDLCREESRRPFDLEVLPLLRATLMSLRDQEHLLFVAMHHIICDGWSIQILLNELATLYTRAVGLPAPALRALPIQYADYTLWQREAFDAGRFQSHEAYWTQQLTGRSEILEIPADRPRPAVTTYNGATKSFRVPSGTGRALHELATRAGVTPFMTFFAAFLVLLNRYTQQIDVVVGCPVANRNRPELEGLIGFFVNALALRVDLSRHPSFLQLLARVRQTALDAFGHQEFPFEKLVRDQKPERHLSYQPLFQVTFVFHDAQLPSPRLPGLAVLTEELESGTAKFDLSLTIADDESEPTGSFEFNSDLFDDATIARMVENFLVLLAGIVREPESPIRSLPIVSDAEAERLVVEWNQTKSEPVRRASLQRLFERHAMLRPDAMAVVDGAEHLTYGELNARANALAQRLKRLGAGPEMIVGVQIERSAAAVVALMSVLKCGAGFVALDPRYPPERNRLILAEVAPPVLITQRGGGRADDSGCRVVHMDDELASGAVHTDNPAESVTGDEICYVVYTSGTTGRPKGILMPYASLTNFVAWQLSLNPAGRGPKTLQYASLNFDMAYQEIFATLCAGGTLVIAADEARADPMRLLEVIAQQGIERVSLTYSVLHQILEAAAASGTRLPYAQTLISSAEELRIDPVVATFFREHPDVRLANYYGPSECNAVTAFWLSDQPDEWPVSASVGRPIANTSIYVLDDRLCLVPQGTVGEVLIGGASVARGYLNRPGVTAEKFVPDPLTSEPGSRLYKTGDLGRHRADGNLLFLGRSDRQTKIRGIRIEPAEIETLISGHPKVRDVFVTALAIDGRDRRLVAYVVHREGADLSASELRSFLREQLPLYMQPSAYVQLLELPLDPNGKVDVKRLPAPDTASMPVRSTHVPPVTALEAGLAEIWREVLAVPQVGRDDNFFDLGGDSLQVARVHAAIQRSIDVSLTVVDLFKYPTVATLAEFLTSEGNCAAPRQSSTPPRAEIRIDRAAGRSQTRNLRKATRQHLIQD